MGTKQKYLIFSAFERNAYMSPKTRIFESPESIMSRNLTHLVYDFLGNKKVSILSAWCTPSIKYRQQV